MPRVMKECKVCEAFSDVMKHGIATRRRRYMIDPLHLQRAIRGSSLLLVSQQILHRHAGLIFVFAMSLPLAKSAVAYLHTSTLATA